MASGFRLERVLRLRTQLRQLVQDEVALLGGRLSSLRADEAAVRSTQAAAHASADDAARAGTTGETLQRWAAYGTALSAREAALAAEGLRVAEAIARGRDELLARRREERKLERLRERAVARVQAETLRQEALLLDDLALRRRTQGEGR